MPVQICGHSQEFFALDTTLRTAQKLWDATGRSGERGQVALGSKSLVSAQKCCSAPDALFGQKKKSNRQGATRI